jgi:hypothetical protein
MIETKKVLDWYQTDFYPIKHTKITIVFCAINSIKFVESIN